MVEIYKNATTKIFNIAAYLTDLHFETNEFYNETLQNATIKNRRFSQRIQCIDEIHFFVVENIFGLN